MAAALAVVFLLNATISIRDDNAIDKAPIEIKINRRILRMLNIISATHLARYHTRLGNHLIVNILIYNNSENVFANIITNRSKIVAILYNKTFSRKCSRCDRDR